MSKTGDVTVGELPPALFIREADSKARLFTISEGSRLLPGDPTLNYNRLKGLANRRLMHQRQRKGSGKTNAALFDLGDLAAARVLMALLDLGISDADVMQAASLACYHWGEPLNPKPAHLPKGGSPIVHALVAAARGEFWYFTLKSYHDDQTGQRRILAIVAPEGLNLDGSLVLTPEFLNQTIVSIVLPLVLLPLTRVLDEQSRRN